MEIKKIKKHRTLQGKLIILLLLPVFLIIFSGGALSFLYTRTALINQWNESAVLKLQRAAHYIEMRLLKPVELIETLFQVSREKQIPLSLDEVAAYLETIEGVLAVGVRKDTGLQAPAAHNHAAPGVCAHPVRCPGAVDPAGRYCHKKRPGRHKE